MMLCILPSTRKWVGRQRSNKVTMFGDAAAFVNAWHNRVGLMFEKTMLFVSDFHDILYILPSACNGRATAKAQVTQCRSGGPDLYDLKNRGHRHGRLMKSWQHRTNILEVGTVWKRSAVIGKPVRQSFTVKLCRVGRDCGYDLFMNRFQSWVESETSWDCRTQRVGIRGQRVGIRGQRMDGREDRIDITIASCLNWCDFCVFIYFKICIYICVYMFIF